MDGETPTTNPEPQKTDTQVQPEPVAPKHEAPTDAPEPKRSIRAELRAQLSKDTTKVEADKKVDAAPPSQQQQQQQPEPADPILPPADMTAEEKAEFSKLSPAAQRYLSRRAYETRNNYTQKTMQLSAKEREFEQLAGVNLGGLRDEYAKHGIPLPTVIENAVAWDRAFRADPKQAAAQFLQAWGLNPTDIAATAGGQPQTAAMSQADIDRVVAERVQAALEQEQQKITVQNNFAAVESFKKSKPLFKDPGTAAQLEAAMEPFVQVAVMRNSARPAQEILEEAYSHVVNSDPQFKDLLAKIDGRAAAEKAKAEAEAALAASRSVSGGPGSGTPSIKPKNLREALRLGLSGQLPRAG